VGRRVHEKYCCQAALWRGRPKGNLKKKKAQRGITKKATLGGKRVDSKWGEWRPPKKRRRKDRPRGGRDATSKRYKGGDQIGGDTRLLKRKVQLRARWGAKCSHQVKAAKR